MNTEKSKEGMSRRELIQGLAVLGVIGASGSVLTGAASAVDTGTNPNIDTLKKVLIERLVNTRYYLTESGDVVVLLNDEVWPGDEGGAYHQDWLFNPDYGLKDNPHAALENNVETDIVHSGIPQDWNLESVSEILNSANQLGLLDDANLIYQVLREKIHLETHGAHNQGVQMFLDWVGGSDELTVDQKDLIADTVVQYLTLPRPQTNHEFY